MRSKRCLIVAVVIAAQAGVSQAGAAIDIPKMQEAFRQAIVQEAFANGSSEQQSHKGEAKQLAAKQSPDGSWPDIDYANKSRGGWPAAQHVSRLLALACAIDQGEDVGKAFSRGMAWWREHDLKCPNWWYNQIGVPNGLARVALVMGPRLDAQDREYIVDTVLPRSKRKMTATNTVWLDMNTAMRGVLKNDPQMVAENLRSVFDCAVVTPDEGVQPDYSFHQHGAQSQFGNYGLAMLGYMSNLGATLAPAGYQIPQSSLTVLRDFALNGMQWTVWHGTMDISCLGRQIFPGSADGKGHGAVAAMKKMAQLDPSHQPEYAQVVARNAPGAANDLIGGRYFWRSDYLAYRRPAFMASVKTSSAHVLGTESINSENLAGYYLSCGATFFYRDGDEYQNIMPLYDWRKIPGVTCAWASGPMPRFERSQNKQEFVGGVSDGQSAVVAMDYARDGVTAAKGYFAIGDNIVCLGSRIASTGDEPVFTTIEQCAAGEVQKLVSQNGAALIHHGLRYQLLSPGEPKMESAEKTGEWKTVFQNGTTPSGAVHGKVFSLWIDHGRHPQDASYAYSVTPVEATPSAKVLANTAALQAVRAGDTVGIIFWQPGSIEVDGHTLRAGSPCAALLDIAKGTLTVAAPTQKLASVNVSWNGVSRDIALPDQAMAGSPVTLNLSK